MGKYRNRPFTEKRAADLGDWSRVDVLRASGRPAPKLSPQGLRVPQAEGGGVLLHVYAWACFVFRGPTKSWFSVFLLLSL